MSAKPELYSCQKPACLLVLLEPVTDLISLEGSCLINAHLVEGRLHSPHIVFLLAPNFALPCRNAGGRGCKRGKEKPGGGLVVCLLVALLGFSLPSCDPHLHCSKTAYYNVLMQ